MPLAPFEAEKGILITKVANGGFIVENRGEVGCHPKILGAYTSAPELLDDLQAALWDLLAEPPSVSAK